MPLSSGCGRRSSTLSRLNSLGRARPNFPGHRASALEPPAHDYFLLRVEADGVFAVGVEVAEEGVFPAGEGEERHGGGDAYVDADHADLAAGTVLAGALTAGGEDGCGVAEGGIDSVVEGVHADYREHRTKEILDERWPFREPISGPGVALPLTANGAS